MAKKSTNILGFMAFSSIIIFAICKGLEILSRWITALAPIVGTLNLIATIFILIVVLWIAWTYASKCRKPWRILYFILLAIIILGFVFGFNIL